MSWGEDPIDPCPDKDDTSHMTVLDTRYVSRVRMTGPAREGSERFTRSAPSRPSKDGAVNKVQELRERIQCGSYAVNSEAVANAILRRLLGTEEEAKS
jgi:hypothetical protein